MSHSGKVWETSVRGLERMPTGLGNVTQSSNPSIPGVVRLQGSSSNLPPRLPPRHHVPAASINRLPSVYGTGYPQSMNYSMFSGYGGVGGSYSGLNGYMNQPYYFNSGRGFGMPFANGGYDGRSSDDIESRFIQIAEESSRPAFQSIASVVRTFASVTMMLESTYNAMFASFQAVLGVADNFNRLRQLSAQIAKYMSALAVIRTLYWFCRRVLFMFGLIKHHPSSDDIWQVAERSVAYNRSENQPAASVSSWPIWTFFGLLFGAPYAIYKLLPARDHDKNETVEDGKWDPNNSDCDEAVALYDFRATYENELSISAGERLKLPPARHIMDNNSGWTQAANRYNKIGFIPFNYIRRLKKDYIPHVPLSSSSTSFRSPLGDSVTPSTINQNVYATCDTEQKKDVSAQNVSKPTLHNVNSDNVQNIPDSSAPKANTNILHSLNSEKINNEK